MNLCRAEFRAFAEMIVRSLRQELSSSKPDRIILIRHYERLAMLIHSTAFRILSFSDAARDSTDLAQDGPDLEYGWITPDNMILYDGGTLTLLEKGWGVEQYSPGPDPDFLDQRLFNSLIQVVGGTSMVMKGFDLNKRAYEALDHHMSNPVAQRIAEGWRHPF